MCALKRQFKFICLFKQITKADSCVFNLKYNPIKYAQDDTHSLVNYNCAVYSLAIFDRTLIDKPDLFGSTIEKKMLNKNHDIL